jgi:hypothetical protein
MTELYLLKNIAINLLTHPIIYWYIFLHVGAPILFIWSLNTLFGLGIPFSFKTWLSCIIILLIARIYLRNNFLPPFHADDDTDEDDDEEEIDWMPITRPTKRKRKLKAVPAKKK